MPSRKRLDPPVSQAGGARTASRNCSSGGYGATKSAKIATSVTNMSTIMPATAPLFSVKADQKAANGDWAA